MPPVSSKTVSRGRLSVYVRMVVRSPGRFVRGTRDTFAEVLRFLVRPRIDVRMALGERAALAGRYLIAQLRVPGATTVSDAIWLTYAAALSTSPSRQWIEVGCYRGLSTVRLSHLAAKYDRELSAYDTFAGLPEHGGIYAAIDGGCSCHFRAGAFSGSIDVVRRNIATFGRPERVTLVPGDIRQTLVERPPDKISFGFLDVDLVESYRACFVALAPAIDEGTVIAIHEAALAPIRALIEDAGFWSAQACRAPTITYVAERYGIPRCRFLALLRW